MFYYRDKVRVKMWFFFIKRPFCDLYNVSWTNFIKVNFKLESIFGDVTFQRVQTLWLFYAYKGVLDGLY